MLTCNKRRSSAQITARRQSILSSKGSRQPLLKSTGMHPAASASRKRYEPRRRPRATRQNVEFANNCS